MEVRYIYRLSDYNALCDDLRSSKRKLLSDIVFWVIFLANAAIVIWFAWISLAQGTNSYGTAWFNVAVAAALLLLRFVFVPWVRRWSFRRFNLEGKHVHVSLGENTARAGQDGIETTLAWSAFTRMSASKTHAFLWINKAQAITIPFDAFTSIEQRNKFLDFANSKIERSAK